MTLDEKLSLLASHRNAMQPAQLYDLVNDIRADTDKLWNTLRWYWDLVRFVKSESTEGDNARRVLGEDLGARAAEALGKRENR